MTMFNVFINRNNIRSRLLAMYNGERRLTNILHAGEVLNQAVCEQHFGMEGLIKWIREKEIKFGA